MSEIQPGEAFAVPYPFIRGLYYEDDKPPTSTWQPGVWPEMVREGEEELVADGVGEMHLHVVSTHKPGRYPERVFYVRQWQDPDGRVFGASVLRIATINKFRRLAAGYAFSYRLQEEQGKGQE